MRIFRISTVLLTLSVFWAVPAHAAIIAYEVPVPKAGNQGGDISLGLDFNVNQTIRITQLGVFDDNQDGIVNTLNVQIFDRYTQTALGPLAAFTGAADTLIGASRFQDIAPLVLTPGQYTVVSWGYSNDDQNFNAGFTGGVTTSTANDGGGLISFVGGGRFSFVGGDYPAIADAGPFNRYDAGTFAYAAQIPEPGILLLFGLGLAGLALVRCRTVTGNIPE